MRANLAVACIIAGCSLFLLWPIISSGEWYVARQAYRYPYLMDLFKASFLAGHIYPRWLPELAGGYGYPTFIFYPPGFWFLALPFALMLDTVHTMYVVLITLLFIGGMGAYKLARDFELGVVLALSCAVLFVATPYVVHLIYVRGSLSELLAMMLVPWVLSYYFRLCTSARRFQPDLGAVIGLVVTAAALIYSHILIAFWLALSLGIVSVWLLAAHKESRDILATQLTASACLAFSLSAPYWYSMVTHIQDAQNDDVIMNIKLHSLPALFGWGEWYLLNPVTFAFALAGFYVVRRHFLALPFCIALLMMLSMALSWTHWLWENITLLGYTRLSVRLISVVAPLQMVGVILWFGWLQKQATPPWRSYAVVGALVIGSLHYIMPGIVTEDVQDYYEFKQEMAQSYEDMTHYHEFTPVDAFVDYLPLRSVENIPTFVASSGRLVLSGHQRDDDIRAQVTGPANILVNQLWFPGWKISVNDKVFPEKPYLDSYGRMKIKLSEEENYSLRIWYDGPPEWVERNFFATLIFLVTAAAFYRWSRKFQPK